MGVLIEFSRRVLEAEESQTLSIAGKAKALQDSGVDVISLATGEPDFPSPDCAKRAAIQALEENFTHYTECNGIVELRAAIAEKLSLENLIPSRAENIIVSNGAKQVIYNCLTALLNTGDEVLVFAPYWVSYPAMIQIAGGIPKIVATSKENAFKVTPEQLRKALSPKTKAVIFNSPCNPTGSMYSKAEMLELSAILANHHCIVVSDEIYEKLSYGTVEHFSIGSIPELHEKVITVNGFSKAYAMTGWRIGYMSASLEIVKQVSKVQGQSTSNINSIAQRAAIAVLQDAAADVESMRLEFSKRKELITSLLRDIDGVAIIEPAGAFYAFANIEKFYNNRVTSSADFCSALLAEHRLALIPGIAFGAEGWVRFSFAASSETIIGGVERFRKLCQSLS